MNLNSTSARPLSSTRAAAPLVQANVAEGAATTVGQLIGTHARARLTPGLLVKDAALSGVANVPFDGLFSSQAYRRGELKANEYLAKVAANSVGMAVWTGGAALAAALLAPVGLPALAVGIAGFALGMTSQGLFDRLAGQKLATALADALPEQKVKPVADAFTKFIANPLNDYVWRPLVDTAKQHKLLATGVAGALALKFPGAAKALGREALTMGGGLAAGVALDVGVLTPLLGASKEPFEAKSAEGAEATPIAPQWVEFYRTVLAKAEAQGATPLEAPDVARAYMVRTLETNGVATQEAEAMAAEMAAAAENEPAPKVGGSKRPGGLLRTSG